MLAIMRRETSAEHQEGETSSAYHEGGNMCRPSGGRKQVVTIRRVKQVLAIIRGETSAGHNEEGNKC